MLRITELRREKNMTQRRLAEELNISQGNLCDWEKGRTEPDIAKLCQLAAYFEVSLDYLVGNADESEIVYTERNLKHDETNLLNLFAQLTPERRRLVVELLRELSGKPIY